MPYIAFDLDALADAPNLARAAGISEDAAIAGLARLWARCFRIKSDLVTDAGVAGVFGGEPERLTRALEAFGFLEPLGGGFRVRGADRYLRLSGANSTGGKARAASAQRDQRGRLVSSGSPAAVQRLTSVAGPASQPSHRTSNIEHRASEKIAGTDVPRRVKADKQPDPRHAPLVKALVEVSPGYAFGGRDARAVSDLLAKAEPQEILRRWKAALAHKGFPTVRAIHELVTHWNHFKQDKSEEYIDATHMSQDELYPEEA